MKAANFTVVVVHPPIMQGGVFRILLAVCFQDLVVNCTKQSSCLLGNIAAVFMYSVGLVTYCGQFDVLWACIRHSTKQPSCFVDIITLLCPYVLC